MPYSGGFGYDPNRCCLPFTRESVFTTIYAWLCNPAAGSVFILTGTGGRGKSAIANTICATLDPFARLGSSFFFDAKHGQSGAGATALCTIAHNIASRFPAYRAQVQDRLNLGERDCARLSVADQVLKFLVEPLQSPRCDRRVLGPILVVLDALDECEELEIGLVAALQEHIQNFSGSNLKLFITSRSNSHTQGVERLDGVKLLDLDAQDITNDTDEDTRLYVKKTLQGVAAGSERQGWCTEVVMASKGLFRWTTTACQFIVGNGPERFEASLDLIVKSKSGSSLNSLYLAILSYQFVNHGDMASVPQVLGRMLATKTALSAAAHEFIASHDPIFPVYFKFTEVARKFEHVFGMNSGDIDEDVPIRLHERSFREFLTDRDAAGDFYVNFEDISHRESLAIACMEVILDDDLALEPSIVEANDGQSSAAAYCCLFWQQHCVDVWNENNLELSQRASAFLRKRSLPWVDVVHCLKVQKVPASARCLAPMAPSSVSSVRFQALV